MGLSASGRPFNPKAIPDLTFMGGSLGDEIFVDSDLDIVAFRNWTGNLNHRIKFISGNTSAQKRVVLSLGGSDTEYIHLGLENDVNKVLIGQSDTKGFVNKTAEYMELLRSGRFNFKSAQQGDILYHDGTEFTRLPAGTDGQYLKTQGAGKNPVWANVSVTKEIVIPMFNGSTPAGGQTAYFNYWGGYASGYESSAQLKVIAGTITKLRINITANDLNSDSTITLRKNGADTSITGTITAGETGQLEFTGSVSVADGDLISVEIVIGGNSSQSLSIRGGSVVMEV